MSEGRAVLVVEDDAAIRAVIDAALSDEGLEVDVAATGRAAVAMARRRRPRMVLLDMMLPDTSGVAVAAELREACGPDLPIIVVTADAAPAPKAASVGAVAHLAKPFDVNELVETVLRYLG